ncbi:MAG: sugar ABC transporter substrate-binding protein [Burkholderiales bacterium]
MKKPLFLAAAAAATIALSLTGCSTPATTGGGSDDGVLTIGLITKFPVDFYDVMVDAAKAWDADEAGAEVIFAQGKSGTDDEGEIAAIQSMVTQGVDAIAITPTSPNVAGELQKAVDAGIPVILIDNDIPDWDGKTAVVATDNFAGGQLAGTWLKDNLPAGAKLAVLQGVLGNPSLDDRVKGMLDTLGDAAAVVATTPTDCDQTKGLNAGQDVLTANPDLTAIYSACGPPLIGALEAVKSAGREGLITVGFDASSDEVKAIIAGTESASVAQFPAKMGSLGVQAAFDAASGKKVDANIDTGTEMVTKDNAADFQ